MENRGNLGLLLYKDYYLNENREFFLNNIEIKKLNLTDFEKKQLTDFKKKELKKLEKKVEEHFKKKNNAILYSKLDEAKKSLEVNEIMKGRKDYLDFKTIYPGLVTGLGYNMGIGVEGEFKNGFYFDWTTGMPIIPGSSIKGVLRSAFPEDKTDENKQDYIKEQVKNIVEKELNYEEIENLKNEIFEGIKDGENIEMYKRDIFFDAEIISIPQKRFMAEDYITPHKEELKNPMPLKFLKVLPEVVFRFKFDLKDGILTAEEKLKLFMGIILDLGVGAKTNVGYGQFDREYTNKKKKEREQKIEQEKEMKLKKEKEEKLKNMNEIERKIFAYEDAKDKDKYLTDVWNELKDFEQNDKIKLAKFLKIKYEELNKWNVKSKKKKQFNKVQIIKGILGEK